MEQRMLVESCHIDLRI